MGNKYTAIKLPDPGPEGLSQAQRDKVIVEIGGGINYFGAELCDVKKIQDEHKKEIYGHKGYPGMKGEIQGNRERSITNKKRIWYIITLLIGAGIGVGVTVGPMFMGG